MNSPNPGFDKQKLHELASAAMNGTANENHFRELTELLRGSAAARDEYLTLADLHAMLSSEIPSASSTKEFSTPKPDAIRQRNWMPTAAAIALAAGLLVAMGWFALNGSDARTNSFATVAHATKAVWDSGSIEIGNRMGPATLRLTSGLVRLEFDSGVEVTLEGPAVFKLVDAAKTELKSGVLTATVPSGAEGFTVDTPTAQVVDLGTSFGIALSNDGFSDVSVFDGEVEIATQSAAQPDETDIRRLSEGQSVRIGTNREVHDIGFDPKPFEKMWPFSSGIVGSTETIEFVPPWPRRIRFVKSDDVIFVRPEGPRVQLDAALDVNISNPGEHAQLSDLSPRVIESGKTVRSYLLHFSPETPLGPRIAKRVVGSITFDRPILGLIVRHEELLASSRRFGRRGAGESNHRRELNLSDNEVGDRITVSEDRMTVYLDLISPGRTSDLARVVVEGTRRFQPNKSQRHGESQR